MEIIKCDFYQRLCFKIGEAYVKVSHSSYMFHERHEQKWEENFIAHDGTLTRLVALLLSFYDADMIFENIKTETIKCHQEDLRKMTTREFLAFVENLFEINSNEKIFFI